MSDFPNLTAYLPGHRSGILNLGRFSRIVMMMTGCLLAGCCFGQNGQQKFTVNVAEGIGVTLPPQAVVNFELTPGSDAFQEQFWNVRSNSDAGVVVEFATSGAFAHEALAGVKVDAGLDVSISSKSGGANWQVTQGSDNSSFASGDERAVVQVVSDGVGIAQVGLTMRFVQSSLEVVPVGSYSSTVTCTVSLP